ncbi:MAG: hypothetical protein JXA66_08670 [Oligoflexia bacterium]|nr:hypothetical protein [Oligoflexia bacterium]
MTGLLLFLTVISAPLYAEKVADYEAACKRITGVYGLKGGSTCTCLATFRDIPVFNNPAGDNCVGLAVLKYKNTHNGYSEGDAEEYRTGFVNFMEEYYVYSASSLSQRQCRDIYKSMFSQFLKIKPKNIFINKVEELLNNFFKVSMIDYDEKPPLPKNRYSSSRAIFRDLLLNRKPVKKICKSVNPHFSAMTRIIIEPVFKAALQQYQKKK